MSEHVGIIGLAATMLVTLVTTTWRFSSVVALLKQQGDAQREQSAKLERRLETLDRVPLIEQRIAHLETSMSRVVSDYPRMSSRIDVLEVNQKHSKEHRLLLARGSRPDINGDDE